VLDEAMAERNGVCVGYSIRDGDCGALYEREDVDEIIAAADERLMDAVIAPSRDRAFRGPPEQGYFYIAMLAMRGIDFEFADDKEEDDGSPAAALFLAIKNAMPQATYREINKKTYTGKRDKALEGKHWATQRKFGHRWVPGHCKHALQHGHWEKIPEHGPWLIKVYELADQDWNDSQIARWLNEQGAPRAAGGRCWWPQNIGTLLAHPMNKGLIVPWRWQSVKAKRPYEPRKLDRKHPRKKLRSARLRPIEQRVGIKETMVPELAWVSEELWQRVQDKRAQRKGTRSPRSPNPSWLAGLVYCGREHSHGRAARMYFDARKDRRPRWTCTHKRTANERCCPGHILQGELEAAVLSTFKELAVRPERLLDDFLKAQEMMAKRHEAAHRAVAVAEAQVKAHQDALHAMINAYFGGELKEDEKQFYEGAKELRKAQLKEAQDALKGAREALEQTERPNDLESYGTWQGRIEAIAEQHGAAYAQGILMRAVHQTFSVKVVAAIEGRDTAQRQQQARALIDKIIIAGEDSYMLLRCSGEKRSLNSAPWS
jgi:Resolvase, N terminal domain/Recombinase/Recombinase zinc beta ribbon domain